MNYIINGKELKQWAKTYNEEAINEEDLFKVYDNGDIIKIEKRSIVLNSPKREKKIFKKLQNKNETANEKLDVVSQEFKLELDFDFETLR